MAGNKRRLKVLKKSREEENDVQGVLKQKNWKKYRSKAETMKEKEEKEAKIVKKKYLKNNACKEERRKKKMKQKKNRKNLRKKYG